MKLAHTQTSLVIHSVTPLTILLVPHPINIYGIQDISTTSIPTSEHLFPC